MSAAERFATWGIALDLGDVPGAVRRTACRHILDGLGCAVAAARTGVAPFATALASGEPAEATVIGSGVRAPAPAAALANGTFMHALDFDDTHAHALVHATAAVLPAALACGEAAHATGADLLTAMVAGYELVLRLGAAHQHGFHGRGLHATSVCGVFSSTLVAARLGKLDARRTVNALGIAGSMAAGSLEFLQTGSSTKQLHPGIAAMNGIVAARLAAAGAEGPSTIFEGEFGLFRSLAGLDVDPVALTAGLGSRWETERITIKPYPVCQLSQASLDALRAAGRLDVGRIDSIMFELPAESIPIVCEPAKHKRRPRTPYEGKFSLPYCAATLLLDGAITIDSFDEQKLARAETLALADRIGWIAATSTGPAADAPGAVTITMADGATIGARAQGGRGGPGMPMSDEALIEKFAANFGGDGAAGFAASIFALEGQPSVADLLEAIA